MRIAISGTHYMGKSTLITDFLQHHPEYQSPLEAYYLLQEQKEVELSLEPSLESLLEQLHCSLHQLMKNENNIIFDRCPVDYLAYAMVLLEQDDIDINDSEVSDLFPEVKEALDTLDLIVFLPISKEHPIDYREENPAYRRAADKCFKKIYRDDLCDIFPRFNHPRIIEISGDPKTRLKILESYLF
ncbi:MAG TPA: AAA family ATPase [Gammaproteobacteria bacterium]|nr:AAA family ATPase [Gammaproteobacteria bacterium]